MGKNNTDKIATGQQINEQTIRNVANADNDSAYPATASIYTTTGEIQEGAGTVLPTAVTDLTEPVTPGQTPVVPNDEMTLDELSNEDEQKEKARAMLDEYMQPYLTAYPTEIVFFITTDGHVFLSSAESDARNHQRRIDHASEVIEYFRD